MKRLFILSGLLLSQTLFATHLTIYDSGIALVEEETTFHFTPKTDTLLYDDIAQSIIPDSITVSLPPKMQLLQQNFQKPNLTSYNIAKSFVQEDVFYNKKRYKLLSLNHSEAFIQDDKGRVHTVNFKALSYPALPKMLHSKSALLLQIAQAYESEATLKVRYLANKLSFSTDYTLELSKEHAELSAWVSITNNTDKEFKNASVDLLAGELNRVHRPKPTPVMYKTMSVANDAASVQTMPRHKSLQNYHLYTLSFPVDIKTGEINRVKLLQKKNIAYTKEYTVTASNPLYLMGERTMQPTQSINFTLPKTALPKGVMRIYSQEQEDKKSLLIGEVFLPDQAKNTPIKLNIGKDFDTKLTQRLIQRKDTKTKFDAIIEYTITNNSDKAKSISIAIPFTPRSDAKIITDEAYRYTKGNLATFTLTVKPNSKKSFIAEFISKRR